MRAPLLLLALLAVGAPPARGDESARARLQESLRSRGGASLDDCFQLALTAAESVGIAAARSEAARARYRTGLGSLLPQLTAEGTYFRQDSVQLPGTGESFVPTEDERQQIRVRLEQAVTRFGAEAAGLSELRHRRAAAAHDELEARRGLYREVALAVTNVLGRQREIAVREESVRAGRERLREMEARQEVGLARRAEALSIRTQLSSDQAALEEARAALAIARQDLEIAIGLPLDVPLVDPESPSTERLGAAVLSESDLEAAVASRPDVRAAALEAEAARDHVSYVRGELLPALDLSASYYVARRGYSSFQEETDWDATITLGIPIFLGGSSHARVAEARALASEAGLALSAAERAARRDVRAAEVNLRSAAARLATLQDGLSFAEESAALATAEYRQGISTNLEVETARVALSEARLALERQRLALVLANIDLELALGRLPRKDDTTP